MGLIWDKDNNKPSPTQITIFRGINLPFPVIGGVNGIVLPTVVSKTFKLKVIVE